MQAKPAKFIWPPRPLPPEAPTPPPVAQAPRRPRGPIATGSSLDLPAPREFSWRACLLEIETAWLGLVRPPLAVRAAQAGWSPDPAGAFCHRCGKTVGEFEADQRGCPGCPREPVPWERFVRVGSYEGLLREAILELKFTAWRRVGIDLGGLLAHSLVRDLESRAAEPRGVVLVPVPPSRWHRLLRGIDHTLTICRGVAAQTGWPIVRALSRRHGPSQRDVAPSKRAANVRGAFRLVRPLPPALTVVVVDDVKTTGATLTEACGVLQGGLGKSMGETGVVWAAAVGVTPMLARPGVSPR